MKRVIVILSLPLLLAMPTVASADRPVREFLQADDLVIEGICDFDVAANIVRNKEFTTSFFDEDGNLVKQLITGALVVELVNVSTDESIVVNIPGPGVLTFRGDVVILKQEGPWLQWFFPGDLGPADPGMIILISGHMVVQFAPETRILKQRGHVQDVCALLAG